MTLKNRTEVIENWSGILTPFAGIWMACCNA